MTSDHRVTFSFIADILDALDRHGYVRGDDQHAAAPSASSATWPASGKAPRTTRPRPHLITVSSSQPAHPSGRVGPDGIVLADGDVSTVVIALDIAADYLRDRAELCADCADQARPTCESRLRDAQAYDRVAAQIDHAADSRAAQRDQPEPGSRTRSPRQVSPAPGLEAGQ